MQFTKMLYALTNSPATFQRITNRMIKPEWSPRVLAYLNDIVIVIGSFEDHLKWLKIDEQKFQSVKYIRRQWRLNALSNPISNKSPQACLTY